MRGLYGLSETNSNALPCNSIVLISHPTMLQASMHASHEIIGRRNSEWAGGVVFIAISLDKSAGTVRERARERGWENALHLWCGPGTWKSEAALTLGIDAVPFLLGSEPWPGMHPIWLLTFSLFYSDREEWRCGLSWTAA